jgi:hypothetical protein
MPRWSALLLFAATFDSSWLMACECSVPSVSKALKRADVVFRGTITKVDYLDPERTVPLVNGREIKIPRRFKATLDVSRAWKGPVTQTFILHTREDGEGDCIGFYSEIRKEVLVFGKTEPADDHFLDSIDLQGRRHHILSYGWLDLVPKGELITSPPPCSLTSEAGFAEQQGWFKRLGRGRLPK